MFIKKIGDLTAKCSELELVVDRGADDDTSIPNNLKKNIYIKYIKGPLFFGSISDIQELANKIPDEATDIIIRSGRMQYMNESGLYSMEDLVQLLTQEGKNLFLIGMLEQSMYM